MAGDGPLSSCFDHLDLLLELVVEPLVEHQGAPHVGAVDDSDRDEQQRGDRADHEVVVEQDGRADPMMLTSMFGG